MKKENLVGNVYGRLKVLSEKRERRNGRVVYLCKCECGKHKNVLAKTLKNGGTRSCGCLHLEMSIERIRRVNKTRTLPKGSERITSSGYVEIKTNIGWTRKHVHVLEKYLGRTLCAGEICHHCDGDKKNNDIENLELMLNGGHTALHSTGRACHISTREKIRKKALKRVIDKGHIGKKLIKSDVIKIKNLLFMGFTYQAIANKFSVSKGNIASIAKKRIWRNV